MVNFCRAEGPTLAVAGCVFGCNLERIPITTKCEVQSRRHSPFSLCNVGLQNNDSQRAKNFVTIETERIENSLKKLKISDDLYNFEDLSKSSLLKLVENNIKTLNDLAELDSEELFNILGTKIFINEDDAGSVIMKAREHWFSDENLEN